MAHSRGSERSKQYNERMSHVHRRRELMRATEPTSEDFDPSLRIKMPRPAKNRPPRTFRLADIQRRLRAHGDVEFEFTHSTAHFWGKKKSQLLS